MPRRSKDVIARRFDTTPRSTHIVPHRSSIRTRERTPTSSARLGIEPEIDRLLRRSALSEQLGGTTRIAVRFPPNQWSLMDQSRNWQSQLGTIITRIVVPLWVLTGALFKLYERSPSNLPSGIVKAARANDVDLHVLLAVLISLEFLAAAVMIFVPKLSRLAAIFMLSAFCAVLVNEMRIGNFTSCGCLGDIPLKPWHMLLIDGSLLVAAIIFRPSSSRANQPESTLTRLGPLAAVLAFVAGSVASFGLILPERSTPLVAENNDPTRPSTTNIDKPPQPVDPTVNPKPLAVPSSYYIKPSAEVFVGKHWREIDLFQIMPKWPAIADTGKHYIVFYSRTCEHCEHMFWDQLGIASDPTPMDAPVTTIEIPDSKTLLTAGHAWALPPDIKFEMLALPLGCDWIITPPLALTIEDGKVTCAVEGEGYEACLGDV
jgi:hypothetical protein